MQNSEIRKLTTDEISKKIKESKQELFELRLKLATGSLEKTHKINELRKLVARLKTILNEKNRGGNN